MVKLNYKHYKLTNYSDAFKHYDEGFTSTVIILFSRFISKIIFYLFKNHSFPWKMSMIFGFNDPKKSRNDKFEVKISAERILNIYFYLFYLEKIKFTIARVNEMLIVETKNMEGSAHIISHYSFDRVFLLLGTFSRDTNHFWSTVSCILCQLWIGIRFCEMYRRDGTRWIQQ